MIDIKFYDHILDDWSDGKDQQHVDWMRENLKGYPRILDLLMFVPGIDKNDFEFDPDSPRIPDEGDTWGGNDLYPNGIKIIPDVIDINLDLFVVAQLNTNSRGGTDLLLVGRSDYIDKFIEMYEGNIDYYNNTSVSDYEYAIWVSNKFKEMLNKVESIMSYRDKLGLILEDRQYTIDQVARAAMLHREVVIKAFRSGILEPIGGYGGKPLFGNDAVEIAKQIRYYMDQFGANSDDALEAIGHMD